MYVPEHSGSTGTWKSLSDSHHRTTSTCRDILRTVHKLWNFSMIFMNSANVKGIVGLDLRLKYDIKLFPAI